jgi:hypothetical protein
MATKRRAPAKRKAATKRRARRSPARRNRAARKWLGKKIRNGLKRAVKRTQQARKVHRERDAVRKAETKRVARGDATPVTKAPLPGAAWWAALVAFWRANNQADLHNGKANDARNRANTLDHQRRERHSTFVCYGHIEPQRFATADELNAHLEIGHPEEAQHPRGSETKPTRNITPSRPPSRPPGSGGAGTRPSRTGSGTRGTTAAHNLAGDAMATLGDIGSAKIVSVSQIKDIAAAIEKIALQFEEAIEGFQKNGRTSEEAPIDAGVLTQLNPAKAGAEQIRTAAVAFVAAFDEYYHEDVQEAQAGERMTNDALTS